MRKRVRIWLLLTLLGLGLLVGVGVWIYQAAHQAPEWYRQAVATKDTAEERKASSDRMEQRLAELASGLKTNGRWEVLFTEAQVNGWLDYALSKKHPGSLPKGFFDPRVKIESDGVWGACCVDRGAVSGVVALNVDIYLAEPNVVALRIRRARLGRLPWPLGKVLDGISQSAREAEVPLTWRQAEGDPVALIRIPSIQDKKRIRVKTIRLAEGKLYVAGVTKDAKP
ncbi:MAG TPA: hypothetical protein VJL29_04185 [Thermoguttaceae bacterium]|nr:hypothetical protein [Thermoguttaceae bacterium]